MEITLTFVGVLLLLGMIQAIYQIIILIGTGWQSIANRLLISLLIFSFLILFDYFSVISKLYKTFPFGVGISGTIMFGIGPSIYLYNCFILQKKKWSLITFFHYIPLLIALVFNHRSLLLGKTSKIAYVQRYYEGEMTFSWGVFIYFGIIFLHLGIYLILSGNVLSKNIIRIKALKASAEIIKLSWLKMIFRIFSLSIIAFLVVYAFWSVESSYSVQIESFLQFVLCSFILISGYFNIKNSNFFNSLEKLPNKKQKYKTSKVTPSLAIQYKNQLLEEMEINKYYLDADLTLPKLAEHLKIPQHQLSQVINQELNSNFFDFINSYRLEEVKKRLLGLEMKQLTILGIALECGFNNKGSFNRIFKNATGLTPSAYIKKHRKAETIK